MMHKSQLRVLLAVNLRLLNPQLTDRLRKKGASGSALSKKLMRQFYLNALMFLGIYGLTMLAFDFSKLPGMFTFYVALFILLGVSQSISGIYNVFFAGNDLVEYLPLPFRNQEIFMSKILVVIFRHGTLYHSVTFNFYHDRNTGRNLCGVRCADGRLDVWPNTEFVTVLVRPNSFWLNQANCVSHPSKNGDERHVRP